VRTAVVWPVTVHQLGWFDGQPEPWETGGEDLDRAELRSGEGALHGSTVIAVWIVAAVTLVGACLRTTGGFLLSVLLTAVMVGGVVLAAAQGPWSAPIALPITVRRVPFYRVKR